MSLIDPNSIVVLVQDSSNTVVRVGVSSWSELREVIRRIDTDDVRRFTDIETQVAKAMSAGVASS